MTNPDFRFVLPGDPFDQEFFKKEGWEKESSRDYSFENGRHRDVGIGTAPPWAKYATASQYVNEELGFRIIVVNHLDYGPSFMRWVRLEDTAPDKPAGLAIYANDRWTVRKLEEEFAIDTNVDAVGSKTIIQKIILKFVREIGGKKVSTTQLEIIRED